MGKLPSTHTKCSRTVKRKTARNNKMLVLDTIVDKIQTSANTFIWVRDEPTEDDLNHLKKEGNEPSDFDTDGLKKQMIDDLAAGKAKLITKSGPYAKVLAVVYPGTKIPWETFAKIFVAFGPSHTPWRVVWFAYPKKREISFANANANKNPGPAHLNGGYAYACMPGTIVIYREEEVERVLIHELLHASCTDDLNNNVVATELLTETWAELFLVAVLANGSKKKAHQLWKIQAQWIANQEAALMQLGIRCPKSFAWRYTVGRREVLEGLGIQLPTPTSIEPAPLSLRFTSPELV